MLLSLVTFASVPRASAIAQEASEATFEEPATDEAAAEESAELPARLLQRDPFDRITLDAANDNAVIETVLLDLPDRVVPNPFPTEGVLKLRRLSHPSIPYELNWQAIQKIELFEQMLLDEAERLTDANEFAEAFEYYSFLATNYSRLPDLEAALQNHLWREASTSYAAGKRDQAWPVLQALYLRNAEYPRLANAVQAVSDDIIKGRLDDENFAAARATVDALEQAYSKLQLENIARWRAKFQADAQAQMENARAALAAEEYSEARDAIAMARSILPSVDGGEELWKEIQGTAPEIRVGVMQLAAPASLSLTPTWPAARVTGVADPRLVDLVDFGAEGGIYASPWGEISTSDDGLQTTLRLSPAAISQGLVPASIALQLTEMARPDSPHVQDDLAALVDRVSIADGQDVTVHWRHPHIRPETFLQAPLRWLTTSERSPGLWFEPVGKSNPTREQRYQRTGRAAAGDNQPRFIVEQVFQNDDAAIEALIRGDVDVLDRVPPWQIDRLEQVDGVVVAPYRLPTIYVLIPNFKNPLLETREFRRAISYGIDAESIVRDILLGGGARPGYRTLSGPFPAGVSQNDPVGYAYDAEIATRPYEPRLASLLAGVARQTLAKREADAKRAEERKAQQAAEKAAKEEADADKEPPKPDAGEHRLSGAAEAKPAESDKPPAATEEDAKKQDSPPPPPLILAHPADPIARLACQSIKIQLDGVGIPVKLVEFRGDAPAADLKYDLLYAELAMWEPILDARRLLGRHGLAGHTSPLVSLALDQLAQSENWNQARAQLNEIHRIAHYDLPVIPLWQTVNYFAYRKSIDGVGDNPVSLYQNLPAWRKSFE
ncbi:MAG: hypothetical protein H0T51_00270 [Pirellulales bacterium]|nr:hypothetical protein [Pirellulales bacterium]